VNILLTNDDGIQADGLWALYHRLSKKHRVSVIAPDRERSAVGHGITLHEPLRAEEVRINGCTGYAVNGTPADCVKFGLLELLSERPALVISGINAGANVGILINYSGTVAAAKEAAVYGINAVAVSIPTRGRAPLYYEDAAGFAEHMSNLVLKNGLPAGTFLNVNILNQAGKNIRGIRIRRQDTSTVHEYFEKRTDPHNRPYYWPRFEPGAPAERMDADQSALYDNHITITPIKCDMTDYTMLRDLEAWDIGKGPGDNANV